MEEMLVSWLKNVGEQSPMAAFILGGLFLYVKLKPKFFDKPKENTEEKFVLKTDCHSHIDGLKEEIKEEFGKVNASIDKLRDYIFQLIQGGKNV